MIYIYIISVAVVQMSLLVKVPSGEEQGETSVFSGYDDHNNNNNNNIVIIMVKYISNNSPK